MAFKNIYTSVGRTAYQGREMRVERDGRTERGERNMVLRTKRKLRQIEGINKRRGEMNGGRNERKTERGDERGTEGWRESWRDGERR